MKYHNGHSAARLEWISISRRAFPPLTLPKGKILIWPDFRHWKMELILEETGKYCSIFSATLISFSCQAQTACLGEGIPQWKSMASTMALKSAFLGGFGVSRDLPTSQGKEGERSGSNPGFQQPWFHFLPCHRLSMEQEAILSLFWVYFHTCDKGVTGSPHRGTERIKPKLGLW